MIDPRDDRLDDPAPVAAWHAVVESGDVTRLDRLLADDVVFRSPAVHQPQEGKPLTTAYLAAAMVVLGPTLRYVHEWHDDTSAVLQFRAQVGGRDVEGIDLFRWNDSGQIVEFTVMIRPFRALEAVIAAMAQELSQQQI